MKWLISHRSSDNSHWVLEAHGTVLVSDSFHIVLGAEIWLILNCARSWLTLSWSESRFESGWLTLECVTRWFTHCFLLIPIVAVHFGLYYAGIWLLCRAGTVIATLCLVSSAVVPTGSVSQEEYQSEFKAEGGSEFGSAHIHFGHDTSWASLLHLALTSFENSQVRSNEPLAKNPLPSECQEISRVFPRLSPLSLFLVTKRWDEFL